jgi:hypothetical protein
MATTVKTTLIVEALQTRLIARLTGAGGYYTNVAGRVFIRKLNPLNPDVETPAVNIHYLPMSVDGEGAKGPKNIWNRDVVITVQCVLKDATLYDDADKFVEDIFKAVGEDETFGGLAIMTNPLTDQKGGVKENEEYLESEICVIDVPLKTIYRTDKYAET